MADDSNNPRYLDICRKDIVFQHFPLRKLRENPGTWAVLSYKFGRLIVKDSNDMEWIYVIKSGEARVIKRLATSFSDPDGRKKRLREKQKQDKNLHDMKMIDFLANKRNLTSHYKMDVYNPRPPPANETGVGRRGRAPPASTGRGATSARSPPAGLRPHSQPSGNKAKETHRQRSQTARRQKTTVSSITIQLPAPEQRPRDQDAGEGSGQRALFGDEADRTPGSGTFLQTGDGRRTPAANKPEKRATREPCSVLRLPPFVRLESLHAGQVFGFRSCLDEEERGPAVSLVSGGCEVLQISKKFFLKHVDEAVLGLIKVKYKAFPSDEEMLDRLDASLEWQEYKHRTITEFLMEKKGKNDKRFPNEPQLAA